MSKQVTSFDELFQTGRSKVQILECLAEIVPPNVLQRFENSTLPVSQPQPQPQAPNQVVEQPVQHVQLTAGPSQKEPQRRRFTDEQHEAMQAFYVVNPHATKKQRRELGELIGLDDTQIYFWYQRQKKKARYFVR